MISIVDITGAIMSETRIDEPSRFDRLVLEWGKESQEKAEKSCITVITDGCLGKYAASYLASAGFGNFRIIARGDLKKEKHFWSMPLYGNERGKAYAQGLTFLNPNVNAVGIEAKLNSAFIRDIARHSDVIIDATNSYESKAWTLDTAMMYNIPAISASCDDSSAAVTVFNPNDPESYDSLLKKLGFMMARYEGKSQDELIAMTWAGLVDEEAKRFVMGENKILSEWTDYSFGKRPKVSSFRNKSALVIGAGASSNLGTYALAFMGFGKIDLYDPDHIESSNLPRTPFFAYRVDASKASTLAEEIMKVCKKTRITPHLKNFDSNVPYDGYDVIIDFVDNDYARGEAYKYGLKHNIPHLSVGTSFNSWSSALCVPEKTACMEHYYPGLMDNAAESFGLLRNRCTQSDPSNSWMQSGAVFGAMRLGTALFPEISGDPYNGFTMYHGVYAERIISVGAGNICDCWKKGGKE